MKKIIAGAALAASMLATPALAANTSFVTESGQIAAPTGMTTLGFNTSDPMAEAASKGISLTSGGLGGQFNSTTYSNGFTFLAPSPQDGGFYAVGGTMPGYAVPQSFAHFGSLTNQAFSTISVFLGSLDSYNVVTLFYTDGTFDTYNGEQLNGGVAPPYPGGAVNTRATFTATNGAAYSGIKFTNNSTLGSLEFDNLAFSAAVPEPATWAMMILGFLGIGAVMRRRRSAKVAIA